jgi:hypothetical protein
MKRGLLLALALGLFCTAGCSASSHDFESVVSGVEQQYSVHAQRIPLMGFISLCARATTLGGVKGMRIAQFDHLAHPSATRLYGVMQSELGTEWQPMVMDRSARTSEVSVIFVRPVSDRSMQMIIASYDNGELDLVRMELDGAILARWVRNPHSGALPFRHSDTHPGRTD